MFVTYRSDDVYRSTVRRDWTSGVPSGADGCCTRTDAVDTGCRCCCRRDGQRRRTGLPASSDVRRRAAPSAPPTAVRAGSGVRSCPCCLSAHHLLVPESASVASERPVLRPDDCADDRADEGPAAKRPDARRTVFPRWSR